MGRRTALLIVGLLMLPNVLVGHAGAAEPIAFSEVTAARAASGSSPEPPGDVSGMSLVTSFTPTRLRQDFSGWLGMRVRIGSSDLQVSALGRWVVAGNSGTHTVKVVDAGTGADVGGGSVSVPTAGAPAGAFRYATLPQPVTLRAGATYYLVSQETAGGDTWYDYDTGVVTTAAGAATGAVYSSGGNWAAGDGAGIGYGPPSLLYTAASGATTTTSTTASATAPPAGEGSPWVTSFTPTWLRNDFNGWVGTQLRVGSSDVSVSALGRWVVSGNAGTHTVKLVAAANGADVGGASAVVATAGAPAGAFRYAPLPSPVTLKAGTTYYLVSQEAAGGDTWYDYDTRLVTSPVAAAAGTVYSPSSGSWVAGGAPGMAYGPVSFLAGGSVSPTSTSTTTSTTSTTTSTAPSTTTTSTPPSGGATTVSAAPVVTGRAYPAMFTVAPDGRIFYAERTTGRIGVFDRTTGGDATHFQVPDLCTTSDQGLYGLALHPQFPAAPSVYAYATRRTPAGTCVNQVLRIDGTMGVLWSAPYTGGHIGGRLLFGPDGNLHVATGDGAHGLPTATEAVAQRAKAQDTSDPAGKILRMTPDGAVPPGNPFGNHVFAYGFRNVFGFDFDPASGRLWATDNGPDPNYPDDPAGPGPSGGCNDEVDLVAPGSNLGWGGAGTCGTPPDPPVNSNQDGSAVVLPKLNIEAASGITGARFCSGCGLGPDLEGRLLWVDYDYRGGGMAAIHAATLDADRTSVVSDAVVLQVPGASPLSIERGPDGALYYSDSQAIHRLVPAAAGSTALVTSFTPPALRRDFSGWVGMQIRVGATDLRVSALGRWVAAGSTGSHTVKLVDAATGADVTGASVAVSTAEAPAGAFRYADLADPVTLHAGRTYYLVSQEAAGGDPWYDYDTRVVTTGAATSTGVVYAATGGSWVAGGAAGMAYGPPNLLYLSSP